MKSNQHQEAHNWRQSGKKLLYVLLFILIALFLLRLGRDPWVVALNNWPVLVSVMVVTGFGLIVQAQSFRAVATATTASLCLWRVVHIWSLAAISSIVAPLFASIATRTVLFVRAGMTWADCVALSMRQFWLGTEISLLAAAVTFPLTELPWSNWMAVGLGIAWIFMLMTRLRIGHGEWKGVAGYSSTNRVLESLRSRIHPEAYTWFVLQILSMSLAYYLGFNGMGAQLSATESIALAAITILLSIIFFVPNGLGIADALWIFIAIRAGLSVDESVAIALIFRLSHLLASSTLYIASSLRPHH